MISSLENGGTRTVADVSPGSNLIYEQSNVFKVYSTKSTNKAIEIGTDSLGNGSVGAVDSITLATANGDANIVIKGLAIHLNGYAFISDDLDVSGDFTVDGAGEILGSMDIGGILSSSYGSLRIGNDLDMRNYSIKNSYIDKLRVKTSFYIPNNVTCDVYSDIDFHNYVLDNIKVGNLADSIDFKNKHSAKNLRIDTLAAINGYATYSGQINFVRELVGDGKGGVSSWSYGRVLVRDGIITSVSANAQS